MPAPPRLPSDPILSPGIDVEVSDTQSYLDIATRDVVDLVQRALRILGIDRASLSIAVVDDATIHAINRRHLNHDWPTDVITFPLSEPDDPCLAGELIVSAEMASTSAQEGSVPAWDEFALYVVHGLLHLVGYDDLDETSASAMRAKESEVLAALRLSNTYGQLGAGSQKDAGTGGAGWGA